MWLRIADKFGVSVSECMKKISAKEYTEQCALYRIDPWGEERADWRIAQLCAMVATSFSDGRKRFCAADFMFDGHRAKPMTDEEMRAAMILWAGPPPNGSNSGNGSS